MTEAMGMSDRLERLVGRFEAMAVVRENTASERRWARQGDGNGGYAAIAGLEAAAQAYRRCADEVRRVMSGEVPPLPNERWDEVTLPDGTWWCEECGVHVDPCGVTYEETHDERRGGCGQPVRHTADHPS